MPSPKSHYEPVNGPCESSRVEQENVKGRIQSSRNVHVKPRYAWVWPKDVKHQNWWGRCKDVLAGRGPDIHVAISSDTRDWQKDWPSKAPRSSCDDGQSESTATNGGPTPSIPWAKRTVDKKYDSRKRKYVRPSKKTCTDPNGHYQTPKAFRDVDGQYWEQSHRWPDPKEW